MEYNFPVRVGQFWWDKRCPDVQFEITRIEPAKNGNGFDAYAKMIGTVSSTYFAPLSTDYLPQGWAGGWVYSNTLKTFSKVNQKTLRKRMREQLAAQLLTERK